MKRLLRITVGGLAATLLLVALCACQSSMPGKSNTADLTPDQRSTGDPPLIPHDIEQTDGNDVCQECHRTGEDGAPKYPEWHATLVDCLQCHVPISDEEEIFKTDY